MNEWSADWSSWLIGWGARALVLSVAIAVGVWGSRRATTLGRHRMVLCSLVVMLVLPMAIFVLPKVSLEWWTWSSNEAVVEAGSQSPWLSRLLLVAAAVWLTGCGFVLLRLLLAALMLERWRHRSQAWTGWRPAELGERRILLCDEIDRPLAFGLCRPAILLPKAVRHWDRRRLRMVLLHENAHIERGDLWFQWLARIAVALYWFHPLVWWLSRQLVELREMATDERVVEQLGGDSRGYAVELVRLAEEGAKTMRRQWNGRLLAAAAMAGEGASALERRVRCLLKKSSQGKARRGILVVAPVAVIGLMLLAACCGPGGKSTSMWTEEEVRLRLTADPFPAG